ncbi:hypothetical protein F5B20DRAFT_588091 [Whalleya microplaca]|nr:hypothetical protein F5B20DRAFT_588091 [Whalleya microplaca]
MASIMHFLLTLLIPGSLGTYTIVCSDSGAKGKIDAAIQEASAMASNAITQIDDLSKDTTAAAFNPLFKASDVRTLTSLYTSVKNIATIPLQITFYCEENHVDWSDAFGGWIDTAFTYTASDGSTRHVPRYGPLPNEPHQKPGAKGSYTLLGYQIQLTSGVADCSNQAHIYVSSTRVSPPKNGPLDHRTLAEINANGLLEGYTALDTLKPLSETIFHELMHAVGGLERPTGGKKRISDNPAPPVVLKKIYGFENCVAVNDKRLILILNGVTPLKRAECPMILAKALYLQIKGKPTYWSTGAVDKDTLKPAGVSNPTPSSKMRRSILAWIA